MWTLAHTSDGRVVCLVTGTLVVHRRDGADPFVGILVHAGLSDATIERADGAMIGCRIERLDQPTVCEQIEHLCAGGRPYTQSIREVLAMKTRTT